MAVRCSLRSFVETIGVDQREGLGKQARALMVVDHDHVEAGVRCLLESIERLCATVDADHHIGALELEIEKRRARWAVPFHQPVGNIDARFVRKPSEKKHKQRSTRRTIDIIVAENRNLFVSLDRIGDPTDALVHVVKDAWIGKKIPDFGVAMPSKIVAFDAAG